MDFKQILANLTDSKQKKMIVAVVALFVVILVCGLIFYFSGIGAADKGNDEDVIIEIPNGTGGSQIIEILDEEGFIKNKFCAKVHMSPPMVKARIIFLATFDGGEASFTMEAYCF